MSSSLDMSLDDIISKNKKSGGGGGSRGGRGRGSGGPGPTRRLPNRSGNRPSPYASGKAPDSAWQHDMFTDQMAGGYAALPPRASAIETGTKLYISNLDYGVSNDDIKELFSEVGDLKRHSIHYDRSGRSKGTAEIVFSRRGDALAAVKRYNNVQLDGKPMKIEIVGTNISTPAAVPMVPNVGFGNPNAGFGNPNAGFGNPNGFQRSGPARGDSIGVPRGGRGRGRGCGRGRGRGERDPVSASDLDADLEKYHQESMQIN